ncbi:MAG: FHA domain-containing protein [Deltaproteobacteria bacterium]|nr:FHA domain-containing protein [Deltaproteobacteria bacterium]
MPVCNACQGQIQEGIAACPACGQAVEAEPIQFGIVCPACDTYNGPGLNACQSCQAPLVPAGFTGFFEAANLELPSAPAPAPAEAPPSVEVAAGADEFEVPAPAPAGPTVAGRARSDTGALLCSLCKTPNTPGSKFCGGCGTPLGGGAGGGGGTMMMPSFANAPKTGEAPQGGTQFFGAMEPGKAKLILIRGEGFEGAEFRLGSEQVMAGRSKGLILFPSDPYLGAHHATFVYRDGRLHVRDEGTPSGTYVRLKGEQEMTVGTELVIGEHRLRYTGALPKASSEAQGATRPEGAVRFEEVLAGGRPGRAWLLPGNSGRPAVIGREGCEIDLVNDRFVSTRHCELRIEGGRCWLKDYGSVNGTFIRLPASSERGLVHGDYLMLGQQVLRVEVA